MKKSILIADSGGTSTEWCFIDRNGERSYFSGRSYHPNSWGSTFVDEEVEFWKKHPQYLADELHFFGAGCFADEKAQKMKLMLLQFGFSSVFVQSDLHGAAIALFGDKSGAFAILGTGSVAAYYEGGEIKELKGGLGYILGDEGSAFSFGKLMLKFLLENRLSKELTEEIHAAIGSRSEIISAVYDKVGRNYVAEMARRFAHIESKELQWIHELNISTFINSISGLHDSKKGLAFCGTYAFHQRYLIKELLIGKQIPLVNVVQNPIKELGDYFTKITD